MTSEQGADEVEPRLVQTKAGRREVYRGRLSRQDRTVTVDREWEVYLGDELMGTIGYEMLTRERRTGQRVYVDARWHSPGWVYRRKGAGGRRLEAYSKADAIDKVVR